MSVKRLVRSFAKEKKLTTLYIRTVGNCDLKPSFTFVVILKIYIHTIIYLTSIWEFSTTIFKNTVVYIKKVPLEYKKKLQEKNIKEF